MVDHYDEARGNRPSAYTGSYTVTGHHIDYVDDTGFTATATVTCDVRDGALFHEHLVLYRASADARQGLVRVRGVQVRHHDAGVDVEVTHRVDRVAGLAGRVKGMVGPHLA